MNHHIYGQMISTRVPRPFNVEWIIFTTNGAEKPGYQTQNDEVGALPHIIPKMKQIPKCKSLNYKTFKIKQRKSFMTLKWQLFLGGDIKSTIKEK